MGRRRRHRYIAAVLMANPKNLDTLALKPFTAEDISKGLSINFLVYSSDFEQILVRENCENIIKFYNKKYPRHVYKITLHAHYYRHLNRLMMFS